MSFDPLMTSVCLPIHVVNIYDKRLECNCTPLRILYYAPTNPPGPVLYKIRRIIVDNIFFCLRISFPNSCYTVLYLSLMETYDPNTAE